MLGVPNDKPQSADVYKRGGNCSWRAGDISSWFGGREQVGTGNHPDWKWRMDLRTRAGLGVATVGHELWRHAWRYRSGQCRQYLCQHTKRYRRAGVQARWRFDKNYSECVSRSSFDGSRRRTRTGVLLRDGAERHPGGKLALHKNED